MCSITCYMSALRPGYMPSVTGCMFSCPVCTGVCVVRLTVCVDIANWEFCLLSVSDSVLCVLLITHSCFFPHIWPRFTKVKLKQHTLSKLDFFLLINQSTNQPHSIVHMYNNVLLYESIRHYIFLYQLVINTTIVTIAMYKLIMQFNKVDF